MSSRIARVSVPDDEGGDQPHAQSVPAVNIDELPPVSRKIQPHSGTAQKMAYWLCSPNIGETGEDHKYRQQEIAGIAACATGLCPMSLPDFSPETDTSGPRRKRLAATATPDRDDKQLSRIAVADWAQ